MTCRARRSAGRNTSAPDGSVGLDAAPATPPPNEPTLDQVLAESIAQPSMRRHQTDETTIRHLLQEIAARSKLRAKDDPNMDDPYATVRLLHETARLWRSRYEREVRARLPDITLAQSTVLIHLAQREGVNQVALAQILDIRPISLVRLLDRLEAAGFVARMPDPDDRRAHVLALTTKALPIIEYIYDLTRKTYDEVQLGISEPEAIHLRALLCRIRSNLMNHRGEIPSSEPLRTPRDA
jgi:MarR family transcriptional regulator, transcriptional regulator for hemolysin